MKILANVKLVLLSREHRLSLTLDFVMNGLSNIRNIVLNLAEYSLVLANRAYDIMG